MKRFKNIVVAVDVSGGDRLVTSQEQLSAASRGALDKATWVAKCNGTALHVLTSLDVDTRAERLIRAESAAGAAAILELARERLDEIVAPLRRDGLRVTTEVAFGRASTVLLDDVATHGRDLVVVGTRERGTAARNLMGSTSLQLLRRCPVAVWVARNAPHGRIGVIVAPVDFGDMAPEILRVASSLATAFSARLLAVHVVDSGLEQLMYAGPVDAEEIRRIAEMYRDEAQSTMQGLLSANCDQGVEFEGLVLSGDPTEGILETATSAGADLVVMSSVVHSAVTGVFLGRTAEKLLSQLTTSLLVLKPADRR